MAALSPLCLWASWRVEAPFSAVSRFDWFFTRDLIVHDAASCTREDSLYESARPCDALSCLLFTVQLLQSKQSILVQETLSAKDSDLTCLKMFPIKPPFSYK